jgi:hypothetical protein
MLGFWASVSCSDPRAIHQKAPCLPSTPVCTFSYLLTFPLARPCAKRALFSSVGFICPLAIC